MLYPPGSAKDNSMTKGDWVGLAGRLSEAGFNVFRFDWRGHGKSTEIKDTAKFWQNTYTGPWNTKYIKGAKPNKDSFTTKDLPSPINPYLPVFLTDLAAVRTHLDSKNDTGDVNTSSIYLIGSEGAASLGFAWLAAEWNRPQFNPTPNQLLFGAAKYEYIPQRLNGDFEQGGTDYSGAVWLSGARVQPFSDALLKTYVTGIFPSGSRLPLAPKIRDNNPMLFLYAPGDAKGKEAGNFFHYQALAAKGDPKSGLRPLNEKYLLPVKNGGNLVGVHLLGNNEERGTENTIMEFMSAIQQNRKQINRKARGFTSPYYIRLAEFGLLP
jgi:pimeloyl-ACP methyl ester carboxylesterase